MLACGADGRNQRLNGRHKDDHDVSPEVLAPLLVEFFAQGIPQPNPVLQGLDVFVGEWKTEISSPAYPSATVHGHASFEWLEGGAFLLMHSDVEQVGPPVASRSSAVMSRPRPIPCSI